MKPSAKNEYYRFFTTARDPGLERSFAIARTSETIARLNALLQLGAGEHAVVLVRAGVATLAAGAWPEGFRLDGETKVTAFEDEYYSRLIRDRATSALVVTCGVSPTIEQPVVRIVHWFDESRLIDHHQTLLVMTPDARLSLVEEYVSDESLEPLSAAPAVGALTQIVMGERTQLQYSAIHCQGPLVRTVSRVALRLSADAKAQVCPVLSGGETTQVWIDATCAGARSHVGITGALRASDSQWFDVVSALHHEAQSTTSQQEYWTVAGGRSRTSFNGNIIIPSTGRYTEADMRNRNLLLSREAEVNTLPKLEISVDEVKCAHGATVSSVSPEQLYYLQCRGIERAEAEEMIVRGFTESVVAHLPSADLQARVSAHLDRRESTTL